MKKGTKNPQVFLFEVESNKSRFYKIPIFLISDLNTMSLHSMSEADKTDKFNYSYLFDNFKKALIEDEDIDLEHYLIGYKELCK